MNEIRDAYIRRVFETALFFRDMHEEGEGGNTNAINLLKPIKSVSNAAVRKFVLDELYKKRGLNLTEAAIELAKWPSGDNENLPFCAEDIKTELEAYCLPHERAAQDFSDKSDDIRHKIKQRSFLRAARYIERMYLKQTQGHSRVVEFFIPDDLLPRGGVKGAGHREHVVPCIYLLEKCLNLFKAEATQLEVANFLQRYVVIVEITKEQQKHLDGSKEKGGAGLKNSMPIGWSIETGCIFERLHEAEITFDPPPGFGICNH